MTRKSIIIILMLLYTVALFAGNVDLSGKWELDPDKNESMEGRRGGMRPQVITITQTEDTLTIERLVSSERFGERTMTDKVSLNGAACESESGRGPKTMTATFFNEGKSIRMTRKMSFDRGGEVFEMNSIEIWSLEDKGKTLKIKSKRSTPRGEREGEVYYKKTEE